VTEKIANTEAKKELTAKTRVFLSYSRKDAAFTGRLAEALSARGYVADYDLSNTDPNNIDSGISAEDEWWLRLQEMITAADVMVIIVSQDSIASPVCDEEIAYARGLGTRLGPVLRRQIDFRKAPPRLSALNVKLTFLDDTDAAFESDLNALCSALDTDIEWYREGRRLTELAMRWHNAGRPNDLLVTESDVRAIGALLERRPRDANSPSPILIELRDRSRAVFDQLARSKQRMLAALGLLMLGVIIGLVGWINQDFIKERYNWFATMRPYMMSNFRPYTLAAAAERALQPGQTFRECLKTCPEIVVVPPGQFLMGSPPTEKGRSRNESPQQTIKIAKPFGVARNDVTFEEWDACAAVGGCPSIPDSGFGRGSRPVINVTWDDAKQYVAWLSRMTGQPYRLLTEAEWEYAARAGTQTRYWWGDEVGSGNAACTTCGTEWDDKETAPVGSFKPNPFGLYDMHGNVFQWVEDCYEGTLNGMPQNGAPRLRDQCGRRVARGGSWYVNADVIRAADRSGYATGIRLNYVGFRVARTLAP
jgi:formylglycine-generating enzyme required for sulfatase activity